MPAKGCKLSEESKRKISKANKGKTRTEEARKKMSEAKLRNPTRYWLGKKKSKAIRRKISLGKMGQVSPMKGRRHTEESKKQMSESNKKNPRRYWLGKKRSEKDRKKMSESKLKNPTRYWLGKDRLDMRGENNVGWKGGMCRERVRIWHSGKYQRWRKSVFERDNYTCQECGKRGSKLEAHHIKSFSKYPKLRFELSNGITLCGQPCHLKTRGKEEKFEKYFIKKLSKCSHIHIPSKIATMVQLFLLV